MENFTNAEYFTLPSRGKVYDTMVVPEVQLKSMTTRHEMMRLSPSNDVYRNFCDIIDDCIVNPIGISAYDLCLGDYQFLMYKLRTITYGSTVPVEVTCPHCHTRHEIIYNLDELEVLPFDEEVNKYKTFTLPNCHKEISLKLLTPRVLDNTTRKVIEMNNKISSNVDQTLLYTIMNAIDTVDGKKPDIIDFPTWVSNLSMLDTNTILAYMNEFNAAIGLDASKEVVCEKCGHTAKIPFKVTEEFFRPKILI